MSSGAGSRKNAVVLFDMHQAHPAMFDFTVLLIPGSYASSVALTMDMLSAAQAMARSAGVAPPRWRVFSAGDALVRLSNGLCIEAKPLPARLRADGSTWVVPGLGITSATALAERLAEPDALRAARALQTHARAGGSVAASCSAVFLLQVAGLLAERRVTTTWWLASRLQALEPRCTVDADRMVVADGQVITAGAALAHTDLMLTLLRMRCGAALADAVSRVMVIDARQAQSPFVVPALLASGNELVGQLTARIEAALPHTPSVSALAEELCISERTLARRVRAATGRSTLDLVQSVRLSRARMLLETTRLPVEKVAEQVGYGDATALRRLMRKVAGATPRQFRFSLA
jgi:transcriptional regulator GlxA family with amidase domain